MDRKFHAVVAAPFGTIGIRMVEGDLAGLEFLPQPTPLISPKDEVAQAVCHWISAYLVDAAAVLRIPLKVEGTEFQQRVWRTLRTIPVGTTWTYAELAERVGSGSRAVANACGANPIALAIPCHRVVGKHGLGGFMQGRESGALNIKQWLLEHERRKPDVAG
jgi:methylated-DNA-[protein]-cysteine S-methyltransferase